LYRSVTLASVSGASASQTGVSQAVSSTSRNTRPRKIRSRIQADPTLPRIAASVITWFNRHSIPIAASASRTATSGLTTSGMCPALNNSATLSSTTTRLSA